MTATTQRTLEGQTALITGASEGIGLAIAERLIDAGAHVLLAARRPDVLSSARERLSAQAHPGQKVLTCVTDVTKPAEVARLFDMADTDLGPLNIAVANAGSGKVGSFLDTSLEDWQATIDLNLTAAFLTVQSAARRMVGRPGENRSIVVTSSIRGLGVRPQVAPYAASKAGVNQMARVAAYELAADGVRVNVLSPGITATPLSEQRNSLLAERAATVPMGRAGLPMDMAEAAYYLCSPASSFVTGLNLVVDGGESLY